MKLTWIQKIIHAPWHSWLRSEDQWKNLLTELWIKLPEHVLKNFSNTLKPLIILPPVYYGRVFRIEKMLLKGALLLQLDERLLRRTKQEALGILAHELAHLCVKAEDNALKNDLSADQLAFEWGFCVEIKQALEKDLEPAHPRVLAIEKLWVQK